MKIATSSLTSFLSPSISASDAEKAARTVGSRAQAEQEKLMTLYGLSSGGKSDKQINDALKALDLPPKAGPGTMQEHLRGLIDAQQQRVNRSFETLSAFQTFMKNVHEMIMNIIRNMRLQP
jgi:hypothetical protein